MIVQAQPIALHLRHPDPDLNCPTVAGIVSKWMEHGRWAGYELQFPGEKETRHLRFAEIRELQKESADEPKPA